MGAFRRPLKTWERWHKEEKTLLEAMKRQMTYGIKRFPRCSMKPSEQRAADRLVEAGVLLKERWKKNRTAEYSLIQQHDPHTEQEAHETE